jgi:sterol 3beta-glucosyltransferase
MRALITTGGTRGDVQPYVALGRGLLQRGIDVRVATAFSFEGLVRDAGLDFYSVSVDLQGLLNEMLEEGHSNPISQAMTFRRHIGPLLEKHAEEFADAGQDADVIFHTPATFMARQVAKYFGVPAVSGELQPAVRSTGEFQSAIVPPLPSLLGDRLMKICNRLSYVFAHESYWQMLRGPLNQTVTTKLGLAPETSFVTSGKDGERDGMVEHALCGWSPRILPQPREWGEDVDVTGYWFLDDQTDWQPPTELEEFLDSDTKTVSIGFGSTTAIDPEWASEVIEGALEQTGLRAVLLTGWSDLDKVTFGERVLKLQQAPHSWLFPRVNAAVHHAGSATVGASLRAGTPTVTIPFWLDQHFWAARVAELGVGPSRIPKQKLTAKALSRALQQAVTDPGMRMRAENAGETIRREEGVSNAIRALEKRGILT